MNTFNGVFYDGWITLITSDKLFDVDIALEYSRKKLTVHIHYNNKFSFSLRLLSNFRITNTSRIHPADFWF